MGAGDWPERTGGQADQPYRLVAGVVEDEDEGMRNRRRLPGSTALATVD